MQKYTYNQLSLTQFIFTIYKTQIGIGVLTLPRDLMDQADTDGWISLLIGWVLSILLSIIIIKTMEKHPNDTLFDLMPRYFGKWLGRGINLVWILYSLTSASIVMITSIHVMQVWILPNTKQYILIMLFIIPIYVITRHGIKVIGRFGEFVYLFTLWMLYSLFFTLEDADWLNLIPIAKSGWMPIFTAVKSTLLSFLGFELAYILYPFLKDKKSAVKGVIIANGLSLLVYLIATILCYVKFSPEEVKQFVWPTLLLLKVVSFPFLERWEIVFLSIYLFVLFMTIIPYLYTALLGSTQWLGKENHRPLLWIVLFIWAAASFFYIPTHAEVIKLGEWLGETGMYMAFVFPVLLWLYSRLFHVGKKGQTSCKN